MKKVCNKCKVDKNIDEFNKRKESKDGKQPACIKCQKTYYTKHAKEQAIKKKKYRAEHTKEAAAYGKEYRAKNSKKISARNKAYNIKYPERKSDRGKLYYKNNKEKIAAYAKEHNTLHAEKIAAYAKIYYKNNKEERNAYSKKYRKEHKGIINAKTAKRRALKLNATPPEANLENIKAFYKSAQRVSKCLNIPHHVDHYVPLKRGGLHIETNLQVIPATENLSKGDKLPEDFYK